MMSTIKYVKAINRQHEPCDTCIGTDDECYMTSCWIREDNGNHRINHDHAGTNPIPCKYHMTAEQYIALIDSLEEE